MAKARIYEVAGKTSQYNSNLRQEIANSDRVHALLVDEDYQMIASHVEDSVRQKIVNCEYVDFARLLP